MPITKQASGKTAFALDSNKWNLVFSKEEGVSYLIFRYAAAPNTNNTTAMTVTVMAAILPVKEKKTRKDNETVNFLTSEYIIPTMSHLVEEKAIYLRPF